MEKKYIPYRIDKNGTKYYKETVKCDKCGGTGHIDYFNHISGGICFACGGSGFVDREWKEYTPEYEQKLLAKRQAKMDKEVAEAKAKADEINQKFFAKNGFDPEGNCWVVVGNTFDIKDELKAIGARFLGTINSWILNHDNPKYNTVKLSVDELYFKDYADRYFWNNWKTPSDETWDKITSATKVVKQSEVNQSGIGEVGEKVELDVTLVKVGWYDTQFGTTNVYTFKDADNHQIVWKTSSYLGTGSGDNYKSVEVGDTVHLKGTIKDVAEYRDVMQTVLTRCKVTR